MRRTTDRAFYIPKGYTEIEHRDLKAVVYVSADAPYLAAGFSGRKAKYDFHLRFQTADAREHYVNKWLAGIKNQLERQQQQRTARAEFKHTLKKGDIMLSTWGYDQTNVDFYQITALIGDKFIELREVAQQSEAVGHMSRACVPVQDSFRGEPLRRRVSTGNYVRITSYAIASLYEQTEVAPGVKIGKPVMASSYA